MGGGTCYNGGWLPPGMPIPSTANGTDSNEEAERVEVTTTGTVRVVDVGGGRWWVIEGDDGQIYSSPTEIPAELMVNGARVSFVGLLLPVASTDGSKVVEILVIEIVQSGGS
jgi:hypothetical protein